MLASVLLDNEWNFLCLNSDMVTRIRCTFRNNTDLEFLLLNYNQIESIEDQLPDLELNTKLMWLELKNNKLSSLPKRFKNLIGLTLLDLQYNQISTLDNILKRMHQLSQLDLTGNRFKSVSISIPTCRLYLSDNEVLAASYTRKAASRMELQWF